MIPKLTITLPKVERMAGARDLTRARKDAAGGMLVYWHKNFMPRHFRAGAERRYQYETRGERYLRQKERIHGHQRPLVYSGELERSIIGVRPATVTTARGARMRWTGDMVPWYTTVNQKVGLNQIDTAMRENAGNIKAAAAQLGVSVRTVDRRLKNRADVAAQSDSKWTRAMNREGGTMDSVLAERGLPNLPTTRWAVIRELVLDTFNDSGRNVLTTAKRLGISTKTVGRYLSNPTWPGKTSGATVDKVKELTAITKQETGELGKVALGIYAPAVRAVLAGKRK